MLSTRPAEDSSLCVVPHEASLKQELIDRLTPRSNMFMFFGSLQIVMTITGTAGEAGSDRAQRSRGQGEEGKLVGVRRRTLAHGGGARRIQYT